MSFLLFLKIYYEGVPDEADFNCFFNSMMGSTSLFVSVKKKKERIKAMPENILAINLRKDTIQQSYNGKKMVTFIKTPESAGPRIIAAALKASMRE